MYGQDNKSFMHDKPYPFLCNKCHYPVRQVVNINFKLKKKYDVSYTYDGYLIVSKRFKDFVEKKAYKNVIFHSLKECTDYFFMETAKIFSLDYLRRNVLFIDLCDECHRYAEVIGATPGFVKKGFEIDDNSFYRSEYEFGSYERKNPLIIVGLKIAKELSDQSFKGIYLKDVLE